MNTMQTKPMTFSTKLEAEAFAGAVGAGLVQKSTIVGARGYIVVITRVGGQYALVNETKMVLLQGW